MPLNTVEELVAQLREGGARVTTARRQAPAGVRAPPIPLRGARSVRRLRCASDDRSALSGPQVHGRVGPPRPPAHRVLEQVAARVREPEATSGAQQPEVAGEQNVGITERTHRDVARRPLADAWQRSQVLHRLVRYLSVTSV